MQDPEPGAEHAKDGHALAHTGTPAGEFSTAELGELGELGEKAKRRKSGESWRALFMRKNEGVHAYKVPGAVVGEKAKN